MQELSEILKKRKDDLTGQKVIVRDNEGGPYKIGVCVGYTDLRGRAHYAIPLVDFGEGQKCCMGIVLPYSEELAAYLDDMAPVQQWSVLMKAICKEDSGSGPS